MLNDGKKRTMASAAATARGALRARQPSYGIGLAIGRLESGVTLNPASPLARASMGFSVMRVVPASPA